MAEQAEPQGALAVFERDDRGDVDVLVDGLSDLLTFAEAMRVQEKYGLSVTFIEADLEWTCTDPKGLVTAWKACRGNTPSAAIFMWLCDAEDQGLVKAQRR